MQQLVFKVHDTHVDIMRNDEKIGEITAVSELGFTINTPKRLTVEMQGDQKLGTMTVYGRLPNTLLVEVGS